MSQYEVNFFDDSCAAGNGVSAAVERSRMKPPGDQSHQDKNWVVLYPFVGNKNGKQNGVNRHHK